MGNGPGALAEYDELAERYPRLHGGFIWEWRDHGLLTRTADGVEFYAYGGDFGEVVHDGNFVMDGMVLPDDTPMPGLAEFAAVQRAGDLRPRRPRRLTIRNRYHTLSTDRICGSSRSRRSTARRPVGSSSRCRRSRPGESREVRLPTEVLAAAESGETWLTVRAELAADTALGAGRARGRLAAVRADPEARAAGSRSSPGPPSPRAGRPHASRRARSLGPADFDDGHRPADAPVRDRRSTVRGWSCGGGRPTTTGATCAARTSWAHPRTPAAKVRPGRRRSSAGGERGLDRLVHRVTDLAGIASG